MNLGACNYTGRKILNAKDKEKDPGGYRSWPPADAKPLSPVGNVTTTFTQDGPMDAANWNENTGERRAWKHASGVRRRAGGKGLQP
jgi:hypothetical protein